METLTSTVVAPSIHTRVPARGSRLFRAGVLSAGLLFSGPTLAASSAPAEHVVRSADPAPAGARAATHSADPTFPGEPNPTGVTTPDTVFPEEISKGEYGVGLGLLILGGVILTAMVVGLFMLTMRRTWGEHDEAPAPSRH
jgi:hypothetical protein